MSAFAWPAGAQFQMGLYKNGQLIDTFGSVAPATNAARKMLSAKIAGTAIPQTAVAPAVSADTQARNQVFADSARLGIQIQEMLRQMQKPELNTFVAQPPQGLEQLASLLQQLIAKQAEVRAAYDSTVARLVELKMPPEIFQRHFDAVAASEAGFAAFTNAVNEVLIGSPGALDKAVELMNQVKLRNEPDLTHKGPTHRPMPILQAPKLTREEADAARTSQAKAASIPAAAPFGKARPSYSPPTSDDLAETPDVQLTTEIRAKSAALGNSPTAIYEFVRNKCAFQPYLGSRKGAVNTLRQLAGNDTDQASLLIALLRAANIPCRYIRGTPEMTPAQAKSWLGVDDYSTAANILATARLGAAYAPNGNLRCTRVWVEAYVPYSNYRGVPNDDTGKTWVPLDPAFKETVVTPGQDVLAAMGYNNWTYLSNYVSTYNSNSPIEQLQLNIQSWLNTNSRGTNLSNIERKIAIKTQDLGLLPASLPNELISAGDPFPSLSDTNRYKVRFHLYDGGTTFIDFTTNLSALAGHKVTINYVGATTNDQALIDSYGGIYSIPPQYVRLINVKPLLKVDGNVVAASVNFIGMGYRHSSDMHFIPPTGGSLQQSLVSNDIIAGNSQAIAFDTFRDRSDVFLDGISIPEGPVVDALLYPTAADYLNRIARGGEAADRLLRTVHTVDVSEAIVESSVAVTYDYWTEIPLSFVWTGMTVDSDRQIVGPFGADGDDSKHMPFMLLGGYDGSFQESDVFEDMYAQRAVSTVRILQVSRDQGIPTCYITNSIASACPGFNHSSNVLNAVNSALANGRIIIIPQTDITYGRWFGTGYIDLDPNTGAAGYIISGGISGNVTASGGATVDEWTEALPCKAKSVTCVPGSIRPPDGSKYCGNSSQEFQCTAKLSVVCDDDSTPPPQTVGPRTYDAWTIATDPNLGAGDYTFSVSVGGVVKCSSTFSIIMVDIEQDEQYKCSGEKSASLNVTPSSYSPGGYTWSSSPSGISGSGAGITYDPSSLTPGTYTVKAESADLSSCYDVVTVNIVGAEVTIEDAAIPAGQSKDVSCTIKNTSPSSLAFNWTVRKTGGSPTVTPTPASGTVTVSGGATHRTSLAVKVNATTSARDSAILALEVRVGSCTMTDTGTICVIPTGETSAFLGWSGGADTDTSTWRATLLPATADFTGRTVHENPAGSGTGTTDTCWFSGSAIPQYTDANSISGGRWTVASNNKWQTDSIGIPLNIDAYYAAHGRTPCALHTTQHMKILCDCCGNDVEYTTNDFDWDVQNTGTSISRGGTPAASQH